jgi:hypothetical protein
VKSFSLEPNDFWVTRLKYREEDELKRMGLVMGRTWCASAHQYCAWEELIFL